MTIFELLALTLIVYAAMYGLFILRRHATPEPFRGHTLFLSLILWSGGYGLWLHYQSEFPMPMVPPLLDATKHAFILLWLHQYAKRMTKNANGMKLNVVFSALGLAIMVTASYAPMIGLPVSLTLSFSGIGLSFAQLWYIERTHYLLKQHQNKNHALIVGLSLLSIIDFALYADIALSQKFTMLQLQWRTLAALLILPFLWRAMNTIQRTPVRLSLSRPLVFKSSLFFIAGSYLLMMSVLGYFFQMKQLNWNNVTHMLLLSSCLLPLIVILLSDRVRREILVWVNKHLFAAQFDYRETWLTLTDKLDPSLPTKEAYDRALATGLNAVHHEQGAYLTVSATGELTLLSCQGLRLSSPILDELSLLVDYFATQRWIVDIPEIFEQPHLYDTLSSNASFQASQNASIRWVVPVIAEDSIVGLWLLGGASINAWKLNWETRDFLFAIAHQMERYICDQEMKQSLSKHAKLAAFHQTSAFVVHDLKNVLSQVNMLLENAKQHKSDPDFVDATFITLAAMQKRMTKMLHQLNNKTVVTKAEQRLNIGPVLAQIVNAPDIKETPRPTLIMDNKTATVTVYLDPEKLTNVIRHLIDNAQHACLATNVPIINISCHCVRDYVIIDIIDNGSGMSPEFIQDRLFQPFDTTKGNGGMGLGVYDALCFAQQLNGELTVKSNPGKGTKFTLKIPKGVE